MEWVRLLRLEPQARDSFYAYLAELEAEAASRVLFDSQKWEEVLEARGALRAIHTIRQALLLEEREEASYAVYQREQGLVHGN